MQNFVLYGDGIHDDLPYIQNELDNGVSELYLPNPKKCYMISGAIKMHSNQTLRLGKTTVIKLQDDANCSMIEDEDFDKWNEHICIDGGVWDMNAENQDPNPWWVASPKTGLKVNDLLGFTEEEKYHPNINWDTLPRVYTGYLMRFCRVKDFTLKNITLKNPVVYGTDLTYLDNFLIENITFEYVYSKYRFYNMDGVHLEGNCRNGVVRNLKGRTFDDLLAITCNGPTRGDIENITVDGIFADHCHSAIRFLTRKELINNITVRNVFGSYFKYCIGFTSYFADEDERGKMRNIVIENVYAHSCKNIQPEYDLSSGNHPFIKIESGEDIENLTLKNIVREEREGTAPFFIIAEGATVKRLNLINLTQKNLTGHDLDFIVIDGKVEDKIEDGLYND